MRDQQVSFIDIGKGLAMATRRPPTDRIAIASLATAAAGVMAWPLLPGFATLLAANLALGLGFLALSRIRRNGHTGRWAALVGIGFGAVFYGFLIATVVQDLIDPVQLQR